MLFENCWEKVNEYTHKVTLTDDALNTMKDAIKENPNGYFGIFIRHGNSSRLIGHIEIAPTLFYDDIFGEKEEFEQFLNSCNSNSTEEIRVKNFWKLFKNNNYKNLQFENQAINIQEIIDNCFGEQIKQLEELESIKQEIEETGTISKEIIDSFNQNPLKIALRYKINQKISGIKFIESIETDK